MLRTVAGYQFFPLRVGIPLRFKHSQMPWRVSTPADLISWMIGKILVAKSTLAALFAVIIAATAFSGFGVPSLTPVAFNAAKPHRVRSEINSRSRWATKARIWLEHIKSKHSDQPLNPLKNHAKLQRNSREAFREWTPRKKWIQDGLRHSFGTYYYNLTRNIFETIFVMGNSERIAKKHYLHEVSSKWTEKYWAIRPTPWQII